MADHELAEWGGGVGLEIADGFAEERPASAAGREVEGLAIWFLPAEPDESTEYQSGGRDEKE